jgi:hypothetical protein
MGEIRNAYRIVVRKAEAISEILAFFFSYRN